MNVLNIQWKDAPNYVSKNPVIKTSDSDFEYELWKLMHMN